MGEQTHLLADPAMEGHVAQMVNAAAYECPTCYFATREALKTPPGTPWPTRMRALAEVQKPCHGCGKRTFHCTAGPWKPGKRATLPLQ